MVQIRQSSAPAVQIRRGERPLVVSRPSVNGIRVVELPRTNLRIVQTSVLTLSDQAGPSYSLIIDGGNF